MSGALIATDVADAGPGVMGCRVEDVGVVVASFRPTNPLGTEVDDEATVGVCRLVFASSNLRSRSRFLGFPADIFGDSGKMNDQQD